VRRKRAHDVLSRHAQPVTGTEGPAADAAYDNADAAYTAADATHMEDS